MRAREAHAEWLAKMGMDLSIEYGLPLVILGRAFKPESNIETGSSSRLMAHILENDFNHPFEHVEDMDELKPAVYIVSTEHQRYRSYNFPAGSVVIDPFRYLPPRKNVKIIAIGGKN